MIGLDTNVLVRYLTQGDPAQSAKASRVIEEHAGEGEYFYLTAVVICELTWVLEEAYGHSRYEISAVIEAILRTAHFEFENKDEMWQAFHDYRAGKADFSDHVIGRLCARAECFETLTLDKALKSSAYFRVL